MNWSRQRLFFVASPLVLVSLILAACSGKGEGDPAVPDATPTAPPPDVPAQIEGSVRLEGRADSSGVQVFIPGSSYLSMTDGDGRFSLESVRPGSFSILAQYPGYSTSKLGDVQIPPSRTLNVITLESAVLHKAQADISPGGQELFGRILGRVTLARDDGPSVSSPAGTTVEVVGTPMRTFCDAEGAFYLWNLSPGRYELLAYRDGYAEAGVIAVIGTEAEPVRVEIVLEPIARPRGLGQIAGTVRMFDALGAATGGYQYVQVEIAELAGQKTIPDMNGRFSFEDLPLGRYTLFAQATGFSSDGGVDIDLSNGDVLGAELVLRKIVDELTPSIVFGLAVKGSANGAAGRGDMSGISVALAGTSINSITGPDGRYRFTNVAPGTYRVIAQAEGFKPLTIEDVEVRPGEELEMEDIFLEPDLIYPEVVETHPADGASDIQVAFEIPIMIRFNKKMRPGSLRDAITISPEVEFTVFAGKEHQSTDFDLARISIDGSSRQTRVRYNTLHHVRISTDAEDYEGLRMREPYEFTFRTATPGVWETYPAGDATGVLLTPTRSVVIRFNGRIDPDSIGRRDVRIRPSLIGIPTLQIVDNIKTGWTELTIQALWEPDTEYKVTLSRGIRTMTGQRLSNTPYTFEFKTTALSEFRPPGVPR